MNESNEPMRQQIMIHYTMLGENNSDKSLATKITTESARVIFPLIVLSGKM